jgi:hypothetical protein
MGVSACRRMGVSACRRMGVWAYRRVGVCQPRIGCRLSTNGVRPCSVGRWPGRRSLSDKPAGQARRLPYFAAALPACGGVQHSRTRTGSLCSFAQRLNTPADCYRPTETLEASQFETRRYADTPTRRYRIPPVQSMARPTPLSRSWRGSAVCPRHALT